MKRDAFSCYDGCRVVMPNGHPFFCSMLMFNGCRVVMPNGHFFFCSMFDVQWVSGGHAEWSSSFLLFNVLMSNGCRVVTEEKLNVQCLMPSQYSLSILC